MIKLFKIPPLNIILGRFGFCKIPLEVVQLAMQLEDFMVRIAAIAEEDHGVNPFQHQIKVARQLVDFLMRDLSIFFKKDYFAPCPICDKNILDWEPFEVIKGEMMEMPTPCSQCDEIKDFADFREDPNGTGQLICEDCYRANDEDICDYRGIPKCCLECNNLERDWNEWTDKTGYYCILNIKLPTKKGSCKKKK